MKNFGISQELSSQQNYYYRYMLYFNCDLWFVHLCTVIPRTLHIQTLTVQQNMVLN